MESGRKQTSRIPKLTYTHEALADVIIAQPQLSNRELAVLFDKTPHWVGYVKSSSAFQKHLAERKGDIIDPVLSQNFEEKLLGLANVSLDVLMEKLTGIAPEGDLALKTLQTTSKAMGYGLATAQNNNVQQNNTYLVAVPGRSASSKEWEEKYKDGVLSARVGGGSEQAEIAAEVVDVEKI